MNVKPLTPLCFHGHGAGGVISKENALGLSQDKIIWMANEKDGKFLLNEIMLSGNFGHHDKRVPKNMNYWKSFWYLNSYNLRLSRFDHWTWFWTPIMRIKGFVWRKLHGYN